MQIEVESEIPNKIKQIKESFYANSSMASGLFKNTNKLNCAKMVSDNIDIHLLIQQTVYVIPSTNKVFFDYTLFKTYANESVYDTIIKYSINLFQECIEKHNTFEMHMDLNTFSISAAQRYKPAILFFCNECLTNQTFIMSRLTVFRVYNTPSMIDSISKMVKPFVSDQIRNKVELIDRIKSLEYKEALFHNTI
jgi:hypothetical protein